MEDSQKKRLDQILLDDGLVTEEQITSALEHQKKYGGKFGSQLLFNNFINETSLVKALSKQFHCEGVVLSNLRISNNITSFIPKRLAVARKIMPFDYDIESNILKIACEDPSDTNLRSELSFVARGKKIKLYLAAELALNNTIARHYLGQEIPEGKFLINLPMEEGLNESKTEDSNEQKESILLVIDDAQSADVLKMIFEADRFQVTISESADDAIDILANNEFHSVFIKDTVAGDYIDLIDRLRKKSPSTVVRYFESTSSLLLENRYPTDQENLLQQNLDLFTSLLAKKENFPYNHSGVVGSYALKLSRKLGLPAKEEASILTAAYLHDLSSYYYTIEEDDNFRKPIELSIKLLKSVNFSPVIIEMLKSMYIDLKHKYTKRLPIEVLGGNILTVVDIFCENISINERLSLDKFESLKKKLRDLTGKLFLTEVVEAFIDMIQDEILDLNDSPKGSQIMLFTDDLVEAKTVEIRLRNEGFRIFTLNAIENFTKLYQRSCPDMIILLPNERNREVEKFVNQIIEAGVDFQKTPAFLLTKETDTSQFSYLLEKGIEDVVDFSSNLDLFMMKLKKIQAFVKIRAEGEEKLKSSSNKTQGRLSDMNLIDLLQAMGPARRTVKITVTPSDDSDQKLVLYLQDGQITYAILGELKGAHAVYSALLWSDGSWSIEPISEEFLPDPNNEQPNEMILMEGCRLMDEHTRKIAIKLEAQT